MFELRNAYIEEILSGLDRVIFTRHAFETSFNNANGEIIRIIFKERPEFSFVLNNQKKAVSLG